MTLLRLGADLIVSFGAEVNLLQVHEQSNFRSQFALR